MLNTMGYRCVVAEDEAPIRRNIIKNISELNMGFTVVGEAMDGGSAVKLVQENAPQLVITDIQMPVLSGIELASRISSASPEVKIIIISGYSNFEYAQQAIRYNVKDYLLKPVSAKDLQSSLTKIKLLLDSEFSDFCNQDGDFLKPAEIVALVEMYIQKNFRKSISIKEIAENLNFSVDYLSHIYKDSTGQSPIKYLIALRMNEAKRLLSVNNELSVKSIGKLVGYDDQYYFSKLFKKVTGVYPSEYKEIGNN
jgi:Response regulator containing CheY-like receiver domain and AraC-type DNA-binding domain